MRRLFVLLQVVGSAVSLSAICGCNSTPSRIQGPNIDPQSAGQAAIDSYDKNGDGVLSRPELAGCPALLSALKAYDSNNDQSVSADEIAARLQSWKDSRIGITSASFFLKLDGRPLSGAKVTLDPEPFLGGAVKPASAESTSAGLVGPSLAPEELPQGVEFGLQSGLYKVRVSHPAIKVSTKYNEQTGLGIEVPPQFDLYHPPTLELTNK